MNYKKLDAWLDTQLPNLLNDLDTLVAINSERTEALPGMPFGKGNADCAAAGMKLLERTGMQAKNYENYVITADLAPEAPAGLDILAHLDVVPAGEGWTVTEPFTMKAVEDRVYGRGTSDDKGPALCALYAMRAIRELGIPVKKNVRLILGFDEECGSGDLEYYFRKEKSAPCSLSPDAEYPMINIEKGGLHSGFHAAVEKAASLPRLVSFQGGVKVNVIPGKAQAVLEGVSPEMWEAAVTASGVTDITFPCEMKDGCLHVLAVGATGHASMPAASKNAITGLLAVLAKLPLSEAPIHDRIRSLAVLFPHGDFYGKALGVDLEDEVSGKTILSLTICSFREGEGLKGLFDCRACLSANDANTTEVVYRHFREAGLEPEDQKMYGPHHVPEESELVQTLMDIYEDMTGTRPKPLCIGGGTYVHHIDNGIAFGCGFAGLDNRIHAADEFMTLEQIRFTCKIYARAILALCGE